jgi:uncharacterized Zn-binding protein involved in type VI secretion
MPKVTRITDPLAGHGCYPGHKIAQGSPNVFANNLNVARLGDKSTVHCCGPACHSGGMAGPHPTVFVNGLDMQKVGDPVDCGSKQVEGSPDVFTLQ